MWKKLISLNLALILLFGLMPIHAAALTADGDDMGYAVFHKNDGSGESVYYTVSDFASNGRLKLYLDMPNFDAEGRTVTSFNTAADGSGREYSFSALLYSVYSDDPTRPAQLYAQWKEADDYHIRYISSDGCTARGKDYYVDSDLSETAELLDEELFTPSEEYQKIVGWSTTAYGISNPFYLPGEEIELNGNLTLYSIVGVNCIAFHYQKYNWQTEEYEASTRAINYSTPDAALNTNPWVKDPPGMIFVGWNSEADGEGDWYTSDDPAVDAPQALYAQYEECPDDPYYILDGGICGFSNGHQRKVVELPNSGVVRLPRALNSGKTAAYWTLVGSQYCYPAGVRINLEESGQLLRATAADPDSYYCAIVDGDGGTTISGSPYAAQRFYDTADAASFNTLGAMISSGGAVTGYKGETTGTVYALSDNLWDAMEAEADRYGVAYFTAQYQPVAGEYIQYVGNGAKTDDGAEFLIQTDLEDAFCSENPFVPPEGQYFLGWNTKADGQGAWITPGTPTADFDTSTVLYAVWGTWHITYHYKSNSGTEITRHQFGQQPDSGQISYRLDHTDSALFAGWNSASTGDGTWYIPGESVPDGTILDLYVGWRYVPTVGYYYVLCGRKMDNGTMVDIVPMHQRSEQITLPSPAATVPDLAPLGWYLEGSVVQTEGYLDEADTILAPGSELLVRSGARFYLAEAYLCTELIKNSGGEDEARLYYSLASGGSLTLYYAEDVFDELPDEAVFTGWNTYEDGSGADYQPGDRLQDGFYTLYAQWQSSDAVQTVPMFRMYDPNSGEHFYTGSEEERDILEDAGWNYEGVGFNFPAIGKPVHRLYNPATGDHLYTMDENERESLLVRGWNYEGVAFNSAPADQVPQYRLWNPNAYTNGRRGAWHFTSSEEERDWLISLGWQDQGIGWYSTYF